MAVVRRFGSLAVQASVAPSNCNKEHTLICKFETSHRQKKQDPNAPISMEYEPLILGVLLVGRLVWKTNIESADRSLRIETSIYSFGHRFEHTQ